MCSHTCTHARARMREYNCTYTQVCMRAHTPLHAQRTAHMHACAPPHTHTLTRTSAFTCLQSSALRDPTQCLHAHVHAQARIGPTLKHCGGCPSSPAVPGLCQPRWRCCCAFLFLLGLGPVAAAAAVAAGSGCHAGEGMEGAARGPARGLRGGRGAGAKVDALS